MAIEFNGKFGNVNNAQVSGKKTVDTEGKKSLAAQKNVFEDAGKVDNKYQGEKTDLLDPTAYYNSLGVSLGNTKKADEFSNLQFSRSFRNETSRGNFS